MRDQYMQLRQRADREAALVLRAEADPQMDILALQHRDLHDGTRLDGPDMHAGALPRVAGEEARGDAFDHLGRGAHPQHAAVVLRQGSRPFDQRLGMAEQGAAVREELLPLAGEQEAAADDLEQTDAELPLQVLDLTAQRRLGQV